MGVTGYGKACGRRSPPPKPRRDRPDNARKAARISLMPKREAGDVACAGFLALSGICRPAWGRRRLGGGSRAWGKSHLDFFEIRSPFFRHPVVDDPGGWAIAAV